MTQFVTLEPWMLSSVAVPVIMVAAMWGDMRRQLANQDIRHNENRHRQDERHKENQEAMHELREDVKDVREEVRGLNGAVAANKQTLEHHASEIRRLRDRET